MPKYKVGDILKNDKYKTEILAVCGRLYGIDDPERNTMGGVLWCTEDYLEHSKGYTLAQPARWIPEAGEAVYILNDEGEVFEKEYDPCWKLWEFRISVGNCFKTREEAEAYKRRWQEWGGKV